NILLLTGIEKFRPIGMAIFYLAVVFTVISGADYLIKNKKAYYKSTPFCIISSFSLLYLSA
ncbi:MAG: hypothetical protein E6303_05900, partial [Clostridium perfringens]|nr:hypothetical protein [Clostridium perfringens]